VELHRQADAAQSRDDLPPCRGNGR
jgi:hypothetical protein